MRGRGGGLFETGGLIEDLRYFGHGSRKCSFPATCEGIFRF